MEASGLERIAHFLDSTCANRLVLDDTFLIRFLVRRLELGFHKPDENRSFSGKGCKRGSEHRESDEAQIGYEQIERRPKG